MQNLWITANLVLVLAVPGARAEPSADTCRTLAPLYVLEAQAVDRFRSGLDAADPRSALAGASGALAERLEAQAVEREALANVLVKYRDVLQDLAYQLQVCGRGAP